MGKTAATMPAGGKTSFSVAVMGIFILLGFASYYTEINLLHQKLLATETQGQQFLQDLARVSTQLQVERDRVDMMADQRATEESNLAKMRSQMVTVRAELAARVIGLKNQKTAAATLLEEQQQQREALRVLSEKVAAAEEKATADDTNAIKADWTSMIRLDKMRSQMAKMRSQNNDGVQHLQVKDKSLEMSTAPPKAVGSWEACADSPDITSCCSNMWKDANHKIVQAELRSQSFSMAVYGNGDIVSGSIEQTGNWESMETNLIIERLLAAKKNGRGVFVDIGANIGWFTFAIAAVASVPVIAFEPFPENLALINHTLCMNPNFQQHIQVFPFGLHSKDNIVCSFWQDRSINTGDTVTVCGDKGEDPAIVYSSGFRKLAEAPMQSLDSFVASGVLQMPPGKGGVVAKMDIEGFEPIAMQGASRFLHDPSTRPSFLFAEVDPTLLKQAARTNALPESKSTVKHFLEQMKLDGYRAELHQSQNRAVFIDDEI